MTSSATRARNRRTDRAQVSLVALTCVAALSAACRRDFEGLKPNERPNTVLPTPPPGRPAVGPPAVPTPVPATGGIGGTEAGGGAGGTGLFDAMADLAPPVSGDALVSDLPAGEVPPAPAPDAYPPEAVFGDTGRAEVRSPSTGVVLYLPLDEGTGSGVTEDASGNANIGSLQGLDPRRAWVDGRFGSALRFPRGGASGVRVSPSPSLNTIEVAWSLSLWVRLTGDLTGDGFIISRRAQGPGGFIYAFGITNGLARLRINSGNGYNLDLSTGAPIPKGPWVHLGVTFDKKTARIYVDGRANAAQVYELGIPQEETPVYLGAGQITINEMLGERYAGDIDEVVMYNRVLPPAEMLSLAGGARPMVP
jgi:hypothetical protein